MNGLNPRQRLIRLYMTMGGCFETREKWHLRVGRGRLENAEARVAALSLAWDLLNGAPMPPSIFNAGLEWRD